LLVRGLGGEDGGRIPSNAIVTPAIAPGDNFSLEVVELPLVSPAAVDVGFSELVGVEEFPPLCVEEVEIPGIVVGRVENVDKISR